MGLGKEGQFQIRKHSCVQEWLSKQKITTSYMGDLIVQKADMQISLTRKKWVGPQVKTNK